MFSRVAGCGFRSSLVYGRRVTQVGIQSYSTEQAETIKVVHSAHGTGSPREVAFKMYPEPYLFRYSHMRIWESKQIPTSDYKGGELEEGEIPMRISTFLYWIPLGEYHCALSKPSDNQIKVS